MRVILLIIIGLSLLHAELTRDSATSVVSDSVSSLQWQDDVIGSTIAWQSAIDRCENLVLGGQSDWRLPNINELKTIIDRSRANPAIAMAFTHTQTSSSYYWSSTTNENYKNNAWYVYFGRGAVNNGNKSNNYYVRCVRAGQ
ncbi:MAG TPA: hypothetical protein CFH84_07945 [Sulfurimonas sp. UBA12504]|nr:MAG: hypothetical protein A2019_07605 [Sulfurimonas sp. GWF2_37_8]DAB29733.1 MAG TPA: hypothetical protein CFH84_07945 [Sulfurimonas sp. UBA12504]